MEPFRLILRFFILIIIFASLTFSLKCRSGDGPSDEDLKRVARSCMRKIGETVGRYNQSENSYGSYGNWDYEDYNRDDRFRQGNRDRLQMRSGRSRRSSNDRRYDTLSNNGRHGNQNQRSNNNNNNNYHGGGNNYNDTNGSYGDRQSRDKQQREHDGACVVHCFFEELNALNNDDYPDKHKVNYVLTKDIRDRELRAFYSDAIQECFHYVEMQRRKDKCQFSKELINCMMEYARANCDDWQDHTLVFS